MNKKLWLSASGIGLFVFGVFAGATLAPIQTNDNIPTSFLIAEKTDELVQTLNPLTLDVSPERPSPGDHISDKQVQVYSDRVILDIQDAEWAIFTNTNSMDPVIDEFSAAIEVVPKTEAEIGIGDIVSYVSEFADGTIIHRVIYKGQDEEGTYFVLKGDNNPASDPGKVRFEQIQRLLVAIVY